MTTINTGGPAFPTRTNYNDTSASPHRLSIVRYNEVFRSHECLTDDGKTVFVDVFVDGSLPDTWNDENIIGQTVEVDYTHGFVWIASKPRIAERERDKP